MQHCGLRGSVPDFRKNTRSITLDPVSEFLFWYKINLIHLSDSFLGENVLLSLKLSISWTEPAIRHMNWHCEHHMYAAVPCYNLKALHKEIAHDMPLPRTLIGAWQEMRMIWCRQLKVLSR